MLCSLVSSAGACLSMRTNCAASQAAPGHSRPLQTRPQQQQHPLRFQSLTALGAIKCMNETFAYKFMPKSWLSTLSSFRSLRLSFSLSLCITRKSVSSAVCERCHPVPQILWTSNRHSCSLLKCTLPATTWPASPSVSNVPLSLSLFHSLTHSLTLLLSVFLCMCLCLRASASSGVGLGAMSQLSIAVAQLNAY